MAVAKKTIGWREWICLPELRIPAIMAKVDTGARTSALHVDEQWLFIEQGAPWVGFRIVGGPQFPEKITAQAAVVDTRAVRDSGGRQTERIFIRTPMVLGGVRAEVEMNLTQRASMAFPMLLGRTAMRKRFVVDPVKSFLCGRDMPTTLVNGTGEQ